MLWWRANWRIAYVNECAGVGEVCLGEDLLHDSLLDTFGIHCDDVVVVTCVVQLGGSRRRKKAGVAKRFEAPAEACALGVQETQGSEEKNRGAPFVAGGMWRSTRQPGWVVRTFCQAKALAGEAKRRSGESLY